MRPDQRQFFDMALVSILSFQFHPANNKMALSDVELLNVVESAARVAMNALVIRDRHLGDL